MRAHDHAGPHDDGARAEGFHDLVFAQRLEAAIGRAGDFLDGSIFQHVARAVFARTRKVGIHRDAGDEQVSVGAIAQLLRRLPHDPWHVAAGVDHRIPAPAVERLQAAVAIAAQLFDLGIERGMGAAAVEQRDAVPGRQRGLDHGPADKLRSADQQ